MASRRCFVALDLPAPIHAAAVEAQRALGTGHPELRLTRAEGLHLTLKFLGEISPDVCADAAERLRRMAGEVEPATVELAGAGCFPPRIVWLALRGADDLQRRVDAALAGLFPPERRFMGHITVARALRIPSGLQQAVRALVVADAAAPVATFSLQQSHLDPRGARYEVLARYSLPRDESWRAR